MPRINELIPSDALTGNELIPLLQDGETVKTKVGNIAQLIAPEANDVCICTIVHFPIGTNIILSTRHGFFDFSNRFFCIDNVSRHGISIKVCC